MKYAKALAFFYLIILLSMSAMAEIRLPVIFQDNMVLQRGKPCAIWGWSSPKEKINLLFRNTSYTALADKNGKWSISLPAQEAGGPFDIQLSGKNKLMLKNILFGDVWICGGQSNMQFHINEMGPKHPKDLKTTSQIRIFTAAVDIDYVPRDDLSGGKWEEASDATVENFSAVAYFFGQYLQDKLHVPIGLISDNLGATAVETWMSPESLKAFPQFRTYSDRFLNTNKSFKELNDAFDKIKPSWIKKYYHLQDDPGFTEAW
ncbi:MAG: sialate O-acetylesterase, partial [Flavitalea sp.]